MAKWRNGIRASFKNSFPLRECGFESHLGYLMEGNTMEMETCIQVVARIWCDQDFKHVTMNPDAAMEIAKILFFVANADEEKED